MEWLAGIVFGLGVLTWSVRTINARQDRRKDSVARGGATPAPPTETALGQDGADLLQALNQAGDALQRHQLYTKLMEKAYRDRDSTAPRRLLMDMGRRYVDEFDRLLPDLRAEWGPEPEIQALKWLTITLEEDGRYAEAERICRLAEDRHVSDGTKTGFAGRRRRIERKREKQSTG